MRFALLFGLLHFECAQNTGGVRIAVCFLLCQLVLAEYMEYQLCGEDAAPSRHGKRQMGSTTGQPADRKQEKLQDWSVQDVVKFLEGLSQDHVGPTFVRNAWKARSGKYPQTLPE